MNLISLLAQVLIGTFNTVTTEISKAIHELTSFNDMAVKSARSIGMPFQQSIAYTKVLTTETQRLAVAYGVTAKEIAGLQDMLTEATGRAALLNHEQMEGLLQTQKFIGEGNQATIVKNMDDMGASVATANSEMIKFVSNASKAGIAVKEASTKFASNLALANTYTFAQGVEGIAKMTLLSQKLKVDLTNIMSATKTFTDFNSAIQASAKMQNLGGLGAAYGANPLTLMYEGLEDPESLMERMAKIFESMAVFDKKTGTGKISGQNMQIIKAQADALGINQEDAVKMARNGVRAQAVQGQMGGTYDRLTEDQQAFVTNKAQWNDKTQKFELNVLENGQMVTKPIDSLTPEQIQQYQKEAAMTTTDAVRQTSVEMVTFRERALAYESAKQAMMAETMYPMLEALYKLQPLMMKLGLDIFQYFATNITNPHWWANIGIGLLEGVGHALIGVFIDPLIGIWSVATKIWNFLARKFSFFGLKPVQEVSASEKIGNIHSTVHEGFSSMYYNDIKSGNSIIQDLSSAWTIASQGFKDVAINLGESKDKITNKLQESLSKVTNPKSTATGSQTSNANSAYSSAINNTTNGFSYAQNYATPNYFTKNQSYSNGTSEVYQAVTNADGSVSYVSSNETTNNINRNATSTADIVSAINEQTDVILSLGTSPVIEQFNNSENQGIKPKESIGNIVKGGEVVNGVTPVSPRNINASSTANNNLSVEPVKLDVSGTINLKSPNGQSAELDVNELLNNSSFVASLTELMKSRLNFEQANARTSRFGVESNKFITGGIGYNWA